MPAAIRLARDHDLVRRGQARQARADGRSQIGASAIEWAIISALVVGLAIMIYGVIKGVVDDNTGKIQEGSNIG